MSFFKKIRHLSSKKSSGRVKLSSSGTLTSKGSFFIYDCTCKVSEITSAYLVIDSKLDRFLFLGNAQKQCFIALDYEGFPSVYEQLSKNFGFDDALFYKYSSAEKPLKARLWRWFDDTGVVYSFEESIPRF